MTPFRHGRRGTFAYCTVFLAEEGGGGKILMINAGAYKGMDACLMAHPGPGPSKSAGTGASLAIRSLDIEFFGHT